MAIDFMIMPLSRYIAGDFVTPTMQMAWTQGIAYAVFTAEGRRDCPPGQPFGGPDAAKRRAEMLDVIERTLANYPPEVADHVWDERSNVEPRFHRVDPVSYRALLERAARKTRPGTWLRFLRGDEPVSPVHVAAPLFLPCAFDEPLGMLSPLQGVAGSVARALSELSSNDWPADVEPARGTLLDALRDAAELRFPLIVDM